MKNLKSILFALLLVVFAQTTQAQDQPKMSDEQKAAMVANAKANQEKLKLTDDQKASYQAITKKYAEKMKALKGTEEERKAKFTAFKALIDEKNNEIKTLLSAEQYKTYLEIQAERKEKMKELRAMKKAGEQQ